MPSQDVLASKLQTAWTHHQAGQLAQAESIYRELLGRDPENAEVTGLLATLLMQKREPKAAKRLWLRALDMRAAPSLWLQNFHALLTLLLKTGPKAEAIALGQRELPAWPAMRQPKPHEKAMLLELVDHLVRVDQVDKAVMLLRAVISSSPRDASLLHALGVLHLSAGDLDAAWAVLRDAEALIQPRMSLHLLTTMGKCCTLRRDRESLAVLTGRVAQAVPAYVSPEATSQKGHILILNAVNLNDPKSDWDIHFHGNYPTQLARRLKGEFRFSSIFLEETASQAVIKDLPKPDLVVNNLANGERLRQRGQLANMTRLLCDLAVPIVNAPDRVVETVREAAETLYGDIPGMIVPRTRRFNCEEYAGDALFESIQTSYRYPMIIRTLEKQQGKGMDKVDDSEALHSALHARHDTEFLVTQFIDSRGESGLFRKIRAAVVGDEIYLVRVDYDSHWNVHGRKSDERVAFYKNNHWLLEWERRICDDPDGELGPLVMQTLRSIRSRTPLDIFGIDFDVDPEGRVVFYEANATMNLLSSANPQVDHPREAEERLLQAFRRYFSAMMNVHSQGD